MVDVELIFPMTPVVDLANFSHLPTGLGPVGVSWQKDKGRKM